MSVGVEFWRGRSPRYVVTDRIRLTPDEFSAMREAVEPDNLPAPPEVLCKVKIGGRWHACDRQYSCGMAMHFARPIVIVLSNAPPAGTFDRGENCLDAEEGA